MAKKYKKIKRRSLGAMAKIADTSTHKNELAQSNGKDLSARGIKKKLNSLSQKEKMTLFSEWNNLYKSLNSIWPENLGIFVYGSLLFKPIDAVDDIDVVILMPNSSRERIVKMYDKLEMHINLLSKDVFLNDLHEGIYGEYYVNKIMNPYYPLRETEELRRIFKEAKDVKATQSLMFISGIITQPIYFSVIDLIKIITCIRIFQFPHYLSSAITMFSHMNSKHFMRFIEEYSITLKSLSSKGIIKQVTSDQYVLFPDRDDKRLEVFLARFLRIVPLYWKTFAEIHKENNDSINLYLKKRGKSLSISMKNYSIFFEVLSNSFSKHIFHIDSFLYYGRDYYENTI